jgi:hypothetical protein
MATVSATVELPAEVQPFGKGTLLLSLALAAATHDQPRAGAAVRYATVSNQAVLYVASR